MKTRRKQHLGGTVEWSTREQGSHERDTKGERISFKKSETSARQARYATRRGFQTCADRYSVYTVLL